MYIFIGKIIGSVIALFVIGIFIYRVVKSFQHYIYTGKLGDPTDSLFGGWMYNVSVFSKHYFTGVHPVGIIADTIIGIVFAMMTMMVWPLTISLIVIVGSAKYMRQKIEHKQEFISNLKGEQINE
jgi:hypothetical protein